MRAINGKRHVDRNHPEQARLKGPAVFKRSNGPGMGGSGAADPGAVSPGSSGEMVVADDHQRAALCFARRSAVADAAGGLPAGDDGSALFLRLARQGALADPQSSVADGLPRDGGTPGLAQRRGGRQPERQDHRKRRACWGSLSSASRRLDRGDAGKKIKGRKRHILTDTGGLLVTALVHTADIRDRDGAPDVLTSIRASFPWLRHVFADGG